MLKNIIITLLFIKGCLGSIQNIYNKDSLLTKSYHTESTGGFFTLKFVSSVPSGGKKPPVSASCARDLSVQVALKTTMALGLPFLPGFSEMVRATSLTSLPGSTLTLGAQVNVTGYCDPSATCSLAAKLVDNFGPIVCKVGTFYQKGPTKFVPSTPHLSLLSGTLEMLRWPVLLTL